MVIHSSFFYKEGNMYSWQVYLSNGKVINYNDLYYPGGTSPWLILVDLINTENLGIIKEVLGDKSEGKTREELKQMYYAMPHDIRPKFVSITNIQLNVNGKIYNSASTSKRAKFKNCGLINHFWIFGQSDFEITELKSEEFISFSFQVDNGNRIFQWVNVETNESWIEIADYSDTRNLKVMREWV